MTAVAARVLRLLEGQGATLAVAESLTGGLVAAELTGVPGASRSFRGSVTAYATELKRDLLGVDAELLTAHGAVHPGVARGMADGVRRVLRADWGLATTGVAGPAPQDGQDVGTVFIAVVGPFGPPEATALRLDGDRDVIRTATVTAALDLLARVLATPAAPGTGLGTVPGTGAEGAGKAGCEGVSEGVGAKDRANDEEENGGTGCLQP